MVSTTQPSSPLCLYPCFFLENNSLRYNRVDTSSSLPYWMLEHKQAFKTPKEAVKNLKEFFSGAIERRQTLPTQPQSEEKQKLEHLVPKVQDYLQNQPKSSLISFTSQNEGEKRDIKKENEPDTKKRKRIKMLYDPTFSHTQDEHE